jgi:toxin ParE1/3/4
MKYVFDTDAELEYEVAADYYEKQGGTELAKAFVQEVERVALMLTKNPSFGRPRAQGLRSFVLRRFPYFLVYRTTSDGIRVLALAHQHRKPGYWLERS